MFIWILFWFWPTLIPSSCLKIFLTTSAQRIATSLLTLPEVCCWVLVMVYFFAKFDSNKHYLLIFFKIIFQFYIDNLASFWLTLISKALAPMLNLKIFLTILAHFIATSLGFYTLFLFSTYLLFLLSFYVVFYCILRISLPKFNLFIFKRIIFQLFIGDLSSTALFRFSSGID